MAASFGLERVEQKQLVNGSRSGRAWEIDAKGVRLENGAIVLIECRRHLTRGTTAEAMASLAYRIIDTGADGGILVSVLEPQVGAKLVADSENILHVRLSPESTLDAFVLQFLNRTILGVAPAAITISGYAPTVVAAPSQPPTSESPV
jgi:hypothetical protein